MRRLLLDTHVLIWWLTDGPQLGQCARSLIADERNEVYVSAASAWEISIKRALGKLDAPDDLGGILEEEGLEVIPVTFFHGEHAGRLPPHHRDPFDRMLMTQAQAEGLELVTSDGLLAAYGIPIVDAGR